jgi:hypothetical protein
LSLVNEAAVATEECYYATEKGQILDINFREMNLFRHQTLYSLLKEVESTIGRIGRPNAAIEQARRMRENRGRNQSIAMSKGGSMHQDSIIQESN